MNNYLFLATKLCLHCPALQKKKSSRRAWGEKAPISNQKLHSTLTDGSSLEGIDSSAMPIQKIGDLDPVKDFEAMLKRRDSPDWVTKAIKDMKIYISDLLENSYEGDTYPKAIECLLALRKGCILEQVISFH